MNQPFGSNTQFWIAPTSLSLARQERKQLLRAFWAIAVLLFVVELFGTKTDSLLSNLGAILITISALFPSYLWCSGRAFGLPIFPLFALTFIWTHALPLVTQHPIVIQYTANSHLFASFTVSLFLFIGTIAWFQYTKKIPSLPHSYRALVSGKGDQFFFIALILGILFNIANVGGWLLLSGGVFSLVRSVALALNALSTFVLSYRSGTRELTKRQAQLFPLLLVASMITSSIGLLLVGAASTLMVASTAFTIGRKKVPIVSIIVAVLCLSLLHYGKAEMRSRYWFQDPPVYVQVWDYPAWYAEWIGYAIDYFQVRQDLPASQEKASFLERSSVIHMLMLAQSKSPEAIPFMQGESYSILPQLLVPRFLNPNKIASHEGTYLLNIHYGLQTREATRTTTIGWGLLAESYANFGLLGCSGLALILGIFYGQVTRWSINAPILSARSLFAVMIMTFSLQTEWTAGVYVAALFQASVTLGGIIVVLMKPHRVQVSLPINADWLYYSGNR